MFDVFRDTVLKWNVFLFPQEIYMPESTCSVGFFFLKIRSVIIYIIWTGHYRQNSQILMQTACLSCHTGNVTVVTLHLWNHITCDMSVWCVVCHLWRDITRSMTDVMPQECYVTRYVMSQNVMSQHFLYSIHLIAEDFLYIKDIWYP